MSPALRLQRALQAWVLLGLLSFALLPWYFLQQGSLIAAMPRVWDGPETASAFMQALQHGRPWLWFGFAGLFICGVGLIRPVAVHPKRQGVLLVCGGFVGTLIIVRPGTEVFGWPLLIPAALVVVNAAFQLLTSKMARTEDAMTTQFYTTWVGTALTSIPLFWFWVPVTETRVLLELVLMGVAGCVGHFLLIMAFERSPAGTLMPYMYAQIGFAMLGGWLVFDHVPDHVSMMGIGLIALCGTAGGWLTVYELRKKIS